MKKRLSFALLITLATSTFAIHHPTKLPVNLLMAPSLKQNAFDYTSANLPLNKSLLTREQQNKFHQSFLKRYYFPWSKINVATEFCITANGKNCHPILGVEKSTVYAFKRNPGYNNRYHKNSKAWIHQIVVNMQLNAFPNINCKKSDLCHGIAVKNTMIRAIPTLSASYKKLTEPGQAYPFDHIQESNLWMGTPVMVLQQTKNHHWLLIKGPGLLGWVKANSIAYTSKQFMQQWRAHPMVTPILRDATIDHNLTMHFPKKIYLGSFFPYVKENPYNYEVLLPIANAAHQAVTRTYHVSDDFVTKWPLTPTPQNFNRIINQLLGMTYGWGGMGYDTDCSGTLRRLFGAFGVWLPRNSKSQLNFAGHIYPLSLDKYSVAQRKAILLGATKSNLPKLKPYLTLIGFGGEHDNIGHVTLYLGEYPQKHPKYIVLFQSVWGDSIMQGKKNVGRAIFGKAVISKLGFGSHLDLAHSGYTIKTHWQLPGIYVTDLTQGQNTAYLRKHKI